MSKSAKVVAVYSLKGGVGKTSLAVNMAAEMAINGGLGTLLWDLDPQSAASFILGRDPPAKAKAHALFEGEMAPEKLILKTIVPKLDLLPADTSLRGLDGLLKAIGKKRRLAKTIRFVAADYDRIVLDCPPGLTETSEQIIRAADVLVVPVIPSALSQRALDEVVAHLKDRHKGHAPLLPVFSMVDRRRGLHKAALDKQPGWPRIPMASIVEQMAERRQPLTHYSKANPAAEAFSALTKAIEKKLAKL
jgi:chromosome partitioning protein